MSVIEEYLSVTFPIEFRLKVPVKRLYGFRDMCMLADCVMGAEQPYTSIDYWLQRSRQVPRGKTPRTARYDSTRYRWFFLYCVCKRAYYHNTHEANAVYDQLRKE